MTVKPRILIVEDESIVALDIQNQLRRSGYIVPGFVASGEEAVVKTAEFKPDLVLMDVKLRGEMDGIEAARQIRERFGIPSIYLTAFADEATLQRAKETEPLAYLVKPFEERELLATIRMAFYRIQVERQLRDSEYKFRSIIEQAMDGIFLIDAEGYIIEWNSAQVSITGISRAEALGRPSWEIWNQLLPDERKIKLSPTYLEGRIRQIMTTGQLPEHWHFAETEIQCPDGQRRILQSRLFLMERAAGHMAGSVSRDVTRIKQMDEAVRQAQKVESLGILAGGAAHDFNNLLVVLLGQTSLALAKLPPDHPAAAHIKKAVEAAERASDLTQQMLAISGQGQFEKQRLHLSHLIQQELDLLQTMVPSHVTLIPELSDVLPAIEADRSQLHQVLTNLIMNAREAIGENRGVIRVETAVQNITHSAIESHRYIGTPPKAGKYVRLTVADSGPGLDADTLSKVFDPFFSTKDLGRGLGLSAVAGIMRGHQGAIRVDSRPGHGTKFSLLFPGDSDIMDIIDQQENENGEVDMNHPVSSAKHVLVIDDQETVCEAVTDILDLENIPVLTALSGQEGVAVYKEHQSQIGLVLLDLSMPGMNGHETYQALYEINPQVPVIFSSGYDEEEILQRFDGSGSGLVGFLKKPYNLSVLLKTVKQHMGL